MFAIVIIVDKVIIIVVVEYFLLIDYSNWPNWPWEDKVEDYWNYSTIAISLMESSLNL